MFPNCLSSVAPTVAATGELRGGEIQHNHRANPQPALLFGGASDAPRLRRHSFSMVTHALRYT